MKIERGPGPVWPAHLALARLAGPFALAHLALAHLAGPFGPGPFGRPIWPAHLALAHLAGPFDPGPFGQPVWPWPFWPAQFGLGRSYHEKCGPGTLLVIFGQNLTTN